MYTGYISVLFRQNKSSIDSEDALHRNAEKIHNSNYGNAGNYSIEEIVEILKFVNGTSEVEEMLDFDSSSTSAYSLHR